MEKLIKKRLSKAEKEIAISIFNNAWKAHCPRCNSTHKALLLDREDRNFIEIKCGKCGHRRFRCLTEVTL